MNLQKKSDETPILTIAYATYNRREIVRKRLIEILDADFSDEVEIIFIDNDSTDGSYNELRNLNVNNKFSIYKNDYNVGFGGNFIEVLKRSNGEFAIWVSDEDSIDLLKISKILKVLREEKPDVLVLNHFKKLGNSLYPIRLNRSKIINETN